MDDERNKRRVLRLLYEEEHPHVTPAFLFYQLGISVNESEKLLDEMTSEGLLILDSDDSGNLYYRLPESEVGRKVSSLASPGADDASGPRTVAPVPPRGLPVAPRQQPYYPMVSYRPQVPVSAPSHSPAAAVLLSFFFVGGGQLYNGQIGKGVALLVASIVMWMFLLGWIPWIIAMVDAYNEAKNKRAAEESAYAQYIQGG